jgi:hypothetical protein
LPTTIHISGTWNAHPKHRRQFQTTEAIEIKPATNRPDPCPAPDKIRGGELLLILFRGITLVSLFFVLVANNARIAHISKSTKSTYLP